MPIQPMTKKVPCECRRTVKGSLGKMCDECQRRECKKIEKVFCIVPEVVEFKLIGGILCRF